MDKLDELIAGLKAKVDYSLPPDVAVFVPPRRPLETDAELAKRSGLLTNIAALRARRGKGK